MSYASAWMATACCSTFPDRSLSCCPFRAGAAACCDVSPRPLHSASSSEESTSNRIDRSEERLDGCKEALLGRLSHPAAPARPSTLPVEVCAGDDPSCGEWTAGEACGTCTSVAEHRERLLMSCVWRLTSASLAVVEQLNIFLMVFCLVNDRFAISRVRCCLVNEPELWNATLLSCRASKPVEFVRVRTVGDLGLGRIGSDAVRRTSTALRSVIDSRFSRLKALATRTICRRIARRSAHRLMCANEAEKPTSASSRPSHEMR